MHSGSLAWARTTKGHLTGLERLRQLWASVVFQVRSSLAPVPGLEPMELGRALDETTLPDTPVVAACFTLVESLGPPALVGHAVRTYVWGTLLGLRDGLTWDRETFAAAALLHDIALARRRHEFTCFAHDGAEQALSVVSALPAERQHTVADAICLHLRVEVPVSLGVEAHLVHAGAGVDVVGRRANELSPALKAEVLRRHPRLDLVDVLARTFREESARHPTSRVARWMQAGFLSFIRGNPLERLQ
ncbi:MAG: hypothetical protein MUC96_28555 [Myxococcaceae bacterium]|nr:hypothetical protein [Myxococcaceae bacterium]